MAISDYWVLDMFGYVHIKVGEFDWFCQDLNEVILERDSMFNELELFRDRVFLRDLEG